MRFIRKFLSPPVVIVKKDAPLYIRCGALMHVKEQDDPFQHIELKSRWF